MAKNKRFKTSKTGLDLEAFMLNLGKIIQKLWKVTLKSNLYAKDKAEILRLMIFASTIIAIIALFVFKSF
jgi:hypothetical protein